MNKSLFAALAVTFAACNDDDVEVIDQKSGSGYYPTKLTLSKTADGCQLELPAFVFRQQS